MSGVFSMSLALSAARGAGARLVAQATADIGAPVGVGARVGRPSHDGHRCPGWVRCPGWFVGASVGRGSAVGSDLAHTRQGRTARRI